MKIPNLRKRMAISNTAEWNTFPSLVFILPFRKLYEISRCCSKGEEEVKEEVEEEEDLVTMSNSPNTERPKRLVTFCEAESLAMH